MNYSIIEVKNLSKKYTISHRLPYETFRDTVTELVKEPFRLLRGRAKQKKEEFWALKDINLSINQGERIGIIGRNGAGKSTLLKVLSQITHPTTGEITIRGRVASLLEVGTGFHPELTGRENIFLNGAILGMKRTEILKKFNKIVAFSEIERFLDTPVKRYSSGMYVRLAFAVAAHLESEILIVDEVLAVGDAQFQKKCLGRMEEVGKEGRTILFVSHNLGAISAFCNRGILLDSGKIIADGEISNVISRYNNFNANNSFVINSDTRRTGTGGIRFNKIWISNEREETVTVISGDEKIFVNLEAVVAKEYQNKSGFAFGIGIDSIDSTRIFTGVSSWLDIDTKTKKDLITVRFTFPSLPLVSGKYFISISVSYVGITLDYVEHCGLFEVVQKDVSFSKGRDKSHGYLNIPYNYEVIEP